MFYSKEDIKALGYDSEVAFVVDYGKKHGNMIARFSSDGVYLDYDFDVQVGVPNIGHVPQPINTRQYPRKNYRLKKEVEIMTENEIKAVKKFADELKEQFEHLMYVTGDEVKERIEKLVKEWEGEDKCSQV